MMHIWKMTIAMMVVHLFTASAATAVNARIDATFAFFRVGASDFEPSSFSGLGDLALFNTLVEDRQTGELVGPVLRAAVSFDITDGDIHAAGSFGPVCLVINPCFPPEGSFQYEDSIIAIGGSTAQLLALEPAWSSPTDVFFAALLMGPFSGGPGIVLLDSYVSGTATLVPEPSALVLLTSAIAALGAIGVNRRRSA
jgi:hypothetical protein